MLCIIYSGGRQRQYTTAEIFVVKLLGPIHGALNLCESPGSNCRLVVCSQMPSAGLNSISCHCQ